MQTFKDAFATCPTFVHDFPLKINMHQRVSRFIASDQPRLRFLSIALSNVAPVILLVIKQSLLLMQFLRNS